MEFKDCLGEMNYFSAITFSEWSCFFPCHFKMIARVCSLHIIVPNFESLYHDFSTVKRNIFLFNYIK